MARRNPDARSKAQCVPHDRYLSYAEGLAGWCAWCHPEKFERLNPHRGARPEDVAFRPAGAAQYELAVEEEDTEPHLEQQAGRQMGGERVY
jgi:hypothetical protein